MFLASTPLGQYASSSATGLAPLQLWILIVTGGTGAGWFVRTLVAPGADASASPIPTPGAGRRDWFLTVLVVLVTVAIILAAPRQIMQTRLEGMQSTIAGWEISHRPLVYLTSLGLRRGTFGDDPGLYLAAPFIHSVGVPVEQARFVLAIVAAVLMTIPVLVVASALRQRRSSVGVAILLPVFAIASTLLWEGGDVYVFPALVALLGLTMLFVESIGLVRSLRSLAVVLGAFSLFCIVATLFRGTSVAVGAVVLAASLFAFRRDGRRRTVLRVLALAVVLLGPPLVLRATTRYRDVAFAGRDGAPLLDRHMFWHSIYIGLGVAPNKYGIAYVDSSAINFVGRVAPTAGYQSPEYEAVLRRRFTQLVREDPLFVARQFAIKIVVVGLSFVFLLPFLGQRRLIASRQRAREFFLAGLAIALAGLLPGLLVVPVVRYASAGVIVLLFLGPLAMMIARSPTSSLEAS